MITKIEKYVQKFVEREPEILAVFLLGSAVTQRLRSDSDIDLGIMMEPGTKLDPLIKMDIAGDLSYELGRSVDIGEISSGNLVYARETLLKGILLYLRDKDRFNLARANLLGMYIQFNMDRQEVVDAYRAG